MRAGLAGAIWACTLMHGAPAFAGPPFRTDDPEPVDYQHFEIYLLSTGTMTGGGWSGTLPGLEVNHGALPNPRLHMIAPLDHGAPADGPTSFAPGDVELGLKYRFVTPAESDWFPQSPSGIILCKCNRGPTAFLHIVNFPE